MVATSEKEWERIQHNYEDWQIDGIEQVIDQSGKYYLSSRGQIVAYFRRLHPGVKQQKTGKVLEDWKHPMAAALQPYTKNKKGEQLTITNIMRRFQNRGAKSWESIQPSKPQQAEYEALGKSLGWQHLIAPKGGYYVAFEGFIRFSECVAKDFEVDLIDDEAEELAAHPEDLVDIVLKKWLHEDDMDSPSSGVCTVAADKNTETDPGGHVHDPVIIVLAIGDQEHEEVKHKRYKGKDLRRLGHLLEEESYL